MNEFTIIFLFFLILGTIFQIWLARRQCIMVRTHQGIVPTAFADTITLADHQLAATYTIAKTRFGQKMVVVDAIVVVLWTLGGGLEYLDQAWRSLEWPPLWTGVVVMMSMMIISSILELPAQFYSTFHIEAKFGFNRTTLALFIMDLIKSLSLTLLLGIPLILSILWLMTHAGQYWWAYVWLVWMGFSLLLMWAYPTLIAPWFNQFKPLEQPQLQQRIEALLQRNGFISRGILVMDGSKRSGHGNAYFTGLGNHKQIVFFDTLLAHLNEEEVEAVLAHEVGHFKRKHTQKRILLMAGMSLAGLAILGWLMEMEWFYHGLGVNTPSTYLALLLFMIINPIFTFFLAPLLAWASRRHEFEADDFAAQQAKPAVLVQALVKLYKDNASTVTPDPWYSAFHDSHPSAPVRVAHILEKFT